MSLFNCVEMLLESSSSSEDSESEYEELIRSICSFKNLNGNPKSRTFVSKVILMYSDETFRQNLRISRSSFFRLSVLFKESEFFPKTDRGNPVTSAEVHVLIFLWFAGNKTVYRIVSQLFDVGTCTVVECIRRVMLFLNRLSKSVIKMPENDQEKQQCAQHFLQIAGVPGVIGAVDGSYINIRTPANKIRSTYTNRHHQTSVTLQGICNAQRKFIDAFTGPSSKRHDASVWRLSFISKKIENICENDYHLLGDSAYPLRKYLLTPYKDFGNLTEDQKRYNRKHSQTRVCIENTFGLLKGRFRQLQRLEFHKVRTVGYFIISCCTLHNILKDWMEEDFPQPHDQTPHPPTLAEQSEAQQKHWGELKRNAVCAAINNK